MQRRERVHGPYRHGARWRVILVGADGNRRRRSFETRAAAQTYADAARGEAQGGRTVSDAIAAFLEAKRARGLEPSSIESYVDRLELLLGDVSHRSLRWVSARGEQLYAAAQVYPAEHRLAGQPRAADTHRNALAVGRMWGRWCTKQRWLRADPFEDVEPVGRKVYGADKPRLSFDESRQLQLYCHAHAGGDPGAVLTLAYLLLGPRASELVRRVCRDVDDGGRLLWIGKTKTRAGRRRLAVPEELVPLLVALVGGRPGDAPLFAHPQRRRPRGRSAGGTAWSRSVAYGHVRRVCRAAGVSDVAPQALRRTQATLATDAGETGLAVARQLGHATGAVPAVTGRAYVGRDAASDAQARRAWELLGNRAPGDPNEAS